MSNASSRSTIGLAAAVLALLILLVYVPVFQNDFIDLDDGDYITENPPVQKGLTSEAIAWAWTTQHHGYWHPLTWLSLQADVSLFGYNAWGMHLTNLVFHIATCVSLFLVFSWLTQDIGLSWLLAALFGVHPLHVESVAWAAERKDVLSTFFLVLTIAAHGWYAARPTWPRLLLVSVPFTIGLLAKPMLVTLPFGLLLLDVWPMRRIVLPAESSPRFRRATWVGLVAEKIPLFVLAAIFSIVTFRLQRDVGSVIPLTDLSWTSRIANSLNGYLWYLLKTFLPWNLSVFHVHRYEVPIYEGVASLIALLGITFVLARRFFANPYLLIGWLWFLGTLFPVSGIAQSGEQAYADRFAYVPHIGLFLALVWGVRDLCDRWSLSRTGRIGIAASAIAAASVLTMFQLRHWRDTVTIWEHALEVDPGNYRAHAALGHFYFTKGEWESARRHMERSLAIKDRFPNGHYDLGRILLELGEFAEAEQAFRRALSWNVALVDARHNLGYALLRQGKSEEGVAVLRNLVEHRPDLAESHQLLAIGLTESGFDDDAARHFARAIELRDDYPEAHHQFGLLRLRQKNWVDAESHLRRATELRPEFARAFNNLGLALYRQGRWSDALSGFTKAVAKSPERDVEPRGNLAMTQHQLGQSAEATATLQEMARLDPNWRVPARLIARKLATHPLARKRDGHRAEEIARQILLSRGQSPDAESWETLALAQAELGQFQEAVATIDRAIEWCRGRGDGASLSRLQREREQFVAGRPIRETETKGQP